MADSETLKERFDGAQRNFDALKQAFPLGPEHLQNTALLANRVTRGEVNADGTIARGGGFTVVRNGVGDYTVTFDTAFSATPVVVVGNGPNAHVPVVRLSTGTPPSTTGFRVFGFVANTAAGADTAFTFTATSV